MSQEPLLPPSGRPDTSTCGRIVAHRGASKVAPENTLAAIRKADCQGAHWLEFDVSLLGDRTPVMHHDGTLERCTDGSGPLDQISASDLPSLDAGGWFSPTFAGEPLATLAQALDLIGDLQMSANLEIKPHGARREEMARAVTDALRKHPWTRQRILVSSFDLQALAALRRLMPEQPIAVLYEDPSGDWPDALARLNASSLHIWYECLTHEILATARAHSIHVRVYTINDPARMERFRDDGLTGVITDHPPLFLDNSGWAAWSCQAL